MPSSSPYQPLSQNEYEEDVVEADVSDSLLPSSAAQTPAKSKGKQKSSRQRLRPGSIDLSKLDNAFKKWTDTIANKMKALGRKKVEQQNVKIEIARSVFDPPIIYPTGSFERKTLDHKPEPMSTEEYQQIVQGVKQAIADGHHPKMISKGSSGSYFARAKVDGKYQIVGVFKPKDEEPYGRLNPKTTKWLHRQVRWIIPFGRACLIPNLSYLSEAAASLLDTRLDLNIVPKTELVSLSSPAFFYDWIDRSAARKGRPLPEKIGSMQYFMHGFQDASEFLRRFPLPDRSISDTYDDSTHRTVNISKRFLAAIKVICGKTGDQVQDEGYDEEEEEEDQGLYNPSGSMPEQPFHWNSLYLQEFREELEKLVILDYLMRNTDRGSDNYMIKPCVGNHEKSLVDIAPSRLDRRQMPIMSELKSENSAPSMSTPLPLPRGPSNGEAHSYLKHAHVHIAAIDNSLSFPHQHPRGWRSYTYGWLYLPVSVVGRPFSDQTRKKILPLLTSKDWWEETTFQLRKLFALDPDFHPKMFNRQLAVIKGQAWNIVQSLKHSDEGPLELSRRTNVLVWDDMIEVSNTGARNSFDGPLTSSPLVRGLEVTSSPSSKPKRMRRSNSIAVAGDFPPPMRRTSTDVSGLPRPVSFATKFPRVNRGASGVAVLEHLERLDVVEAGLKRLGEEEIVEEEEEDIGGDSVPSSQPPAVEQTATQHSHSADPFSDDGLDNQIGEDSDITTQTPEMLAKSLPQLGSPTPHVRWASAHNAPNQSASRRSVDFWHRELDPPPKKTMIVERLEVVKDKPFLTCW